MITKDLIKNLQKLVDDHAPHIPVMGEHEIMIDCYRIVSEAYPNYHYHYAGISPDILIDRTADGVYDVLCAKPE